MSGVCDMCRRTTCEYRADDIAVCGLPKTETNYEKLFGTPERAARTLSPDDMSCWWCLLHDHCKDECLIDERGRLLEWLRGDA